MALTDAVHNYCTYNWKVECGLRSRDDTPISSPGRRIFYYHYAIQKVRKKSINKIIREQLT